MIWFRLGAVVLSLYVYDSQHQQLLLAVFLANGHNSLVVFGHFDLDYVHAHGHCGYLRSTVQSPQANCLIGRARYDQVVQGDRCAYDLTSVSTQYRNETLRVRIPHFGCAITACTHQMLFVLRQGDLINGGSMCLRVHWVHVGHTRFARVDVPLNQVATTCARYHFVVVEDLNALGISIERYASCLRDLCRFGQVEHDKVGSVLRSTTDNRVSLIRCNRDRFGILTERNCRIRFNLFDELVCDQVQNAHADTTTEALIASHEYRVGIGAWLEHATLDLMRHLYRFARLHFPQLQ